MNRSSATSPNAAQAATSPSERAGQAAPKREVSWSDPSSREKFARSTDLVSQCWGRAPDEVYAPVGRFNLGAMTWNWRARARSNAHASPLHRISVQLAGAGRIDRIEAKGRVRKGVGIGQFSIRPAGQVVSNEIHPPNRVVTFSLCPKFLATVAEETFEIATEAMELRPMFAERDPVIEQMARVVDETSRDLFMGSALYRDGVAQILAVHLLRRYCAPAGRSVSPLRLNDLDSRLALVIDCIEERLGEALRLNDLAEVAGLSPYHFLRSFKKAVGITPHRFVMRRRVERAKDRLRMTDDGLAQIALELGFANQGHFTSSFRAETGATPRRFRLSYGRGAPAAEAERRAAARDDDA